ncbi:translation machinery-associated protein 16 homolog [Uloborus diversus]|uniref:translation machinery-associated protein 16 homolog n=1 Tax=Uloborus diversus TaxID=327109 RepID=UPI002409C732|nr:translation machinery-associated protein 16 homolog [Uloborus diversus]
MYVSQTKQLKKLKWFKENINSEKSTCSAAEFKEVIERYLSRFDEEQKKLDVKSIKGRHAHERITLEYKVKFSVAKEKNEFNTGGLELPNLLDKETFEKLKKWNGEARFISLFPMTLITRDSLEESIAKANS